jgi:NADH-quinone oxidoreductase subunit F
VVLKLLTLPVEVVTDDATGKVAGVKCRHMRLGTFDRTGRRRPEAEGSEFIVKADQVLVAIGQTLDLNEVCDGTNIEARKNSFINTDPVTGQTSVPWVFAGGDAVTGPASVVDAVAAGERAAVGMDEYLSGENHAFWRKDKVVDTYFNPNADPMPYEREKPKTISIERRRNNFDEVEQCWTENVAIRQASRCLRCDYGKRR